MAETDLMLVIPDQANGASPISGASWAFGNWVTVITHTQDNFIINGLTWQVTNVPTADTTYEQIFEIGVGDAGSETTIAQVPYSFRADTAADYYVDTYTFYFPEAIIVAPNRRIAVRAASSDAATITYNGVKLRYQATVIMPALATAGFPNNYQHPKSVSAGIMSIGEKIR